MENKENLFKIDDHVDLEAVGGRNVNNKYKGDIILAMVDLPVDKVKSIKIGKEVFKTPNTATTNVCQYKNYIRETYPALKNAEYVTRRFLDNDGKYNHIRVWRIK